MSGLSLQLADGKTKFRPGERVEGLAFWELDEAPKSLEVRLYWRTQGKGTVDLEIVRTELVPVPFAAGRRAFAFELPAGPYSMSGRLVSIVWGVELVAEPKGQSENVGITLSPTGEEVRIDLWEEKK